jgi:PAS domain S-box-containing protein
VHTKTTSANPQLQGVVLALRRGEDAVLEQLPDLLAAAGHLPKGANDSDGCARLYRRLTEPFYRLLESGGQRLTRSAIAKALDTDVVDIHQACVRTWGGGGASSLLGGLKTLAGALTDHIAGLEATQEQRLQAVLAARQYFDALEALLIDLQERHSETAPRRKGGATELLRDLLRRKAGDGSPAPSLEPPERLLRSLFHGSRNAQILADAKLRIVAANAAAEEIFGHAADAMLGRDFMLLVPGGEQEPLAQAIEALDAETPWQGESKGLHSGGQTFPLELRMLRVPLAQGAGGHVYQIMLRDRSRVNRLEQGMRYQKAQVEDMAVTLKNVMRSIEREKEAFKSDFARKVESEILPALVRMTGEESLDVRKSYESVIRKELTDLTRGKAQSLSSQLLDLTPTEMEICQYIQAGRSTKEIAEMMNSAFETIQTHRKNIRKKLELKGKKTTLYGFLKSLGPLSNE